MTLNVDSIGQFGLVTLRTSELFPSPDLLTSGEGACCHLPKTAPLLSAFSLNFWPFSLDPQ